MNYDLIKNRVLEEAAYIIRTKDNVRNTAKKFGYSKSTVHRDMRVRLKQFNPLMCQAIDKILEFNKEQRAARGGEATRRRYQAN